ncbi:hypothetical protein [Bdellovibrio bacteriovorus]|uniref:hypothetical protein n=1 Tax=Bdellovibrio TaxID=958 RepID=UPI0035A861B9
MKLRLSIISVLVLAITSTASARLSRGVKEGGGDESIIFICKSPANTDSNLQIIGFGSDFNDIQLHVFTQGHLIALDLGTLDLRSHRYVGQTYDISLQRTASITAKEPNYALLVGASASLICK